MKRDLTREKMRRGDSFRLKLKDWKDALVAEGWGAGKEDWMPILDSRADFGQNRNGSSNLDQENRDHHDQKGHHRMHRGAQRAMIRVASHQMHVGYLCNGQKRYQDQANHGYQPKSSCFWAAIAV